jgi:hypothetical protein
MYFSSVLFVLSVPLILPFFIQMNPSKSEFLCIISYHASILQRGTVSPRPALKPKSDKFNAIRICTIEIMHVNGLLYRTNMNPQFLLSLWHESELFKQNRRNRPIHISSFNLLTHYNYDTYIILRVFTSACSKI